MTRKTVKTGTKIPKIWKALFKKGKSARLDWNRDKWARKTLKHLQPHWKTLTLVRQPNKLARNQANSWSDSIWQQLSLKQISARKLSDSEVPETKVIKFIRRIFKLCETISGEAENVKL